MKHFEKISPEELQILENAVSQIAVLIAGAEGDISKDETDWATKLVHIRTFSGEMALKNFYEQVEANFNIKFREVIKNSPQDLDTRQAALSADIARINPILAKLDEHTAYEMYHSYVTLAKSIAKASGGILGFGAISSAEQKWIGLPMLTPIKKPLPDIEIEEEA